MWISETLYLYCSSVIHLVARKTSVVVLRLRLSCTPTIRHLATPGRTAAKVGHIKHSDLSMIDYYPSSSSSKPVVS